VSAPAAVPGMLARLRELLLEQGGLIATLVSRQAASTDSLGEHTPAQLAAAGPRAAASPSDYELLIETIYEGYLLHYHSPRVVRAGDPDVQLLAGDQLYALGLARLVSLGDVAAVAELADVITLSALAHGAGVGELAHAIWVEGARAVGWGPSIAYRRAKDMARSGSPAALAALAGAASA
jgi:hypothetical protein